MTTTKRKAHWSDVLVAAGMSPCRSGLRWARRRPTYAAAWRECRDPSKMIWLLLRLWMRTDSSDALAKGAYHEAYHVAYQRPEPGTKQAARCDAIRAAVKRPKLPGLR